LKVKEILCRSILNKCGIEGIDYSLNPYIGCEHGCIYCYARYMGRYAGHEEEWGTFVDVKINAPSMLSRELKKKSRGLVLLSTVTDPYQPLEEKYRITRRCLERLLLYRFPVTIMTKSSLVLRDFDLLRRFESCELGMTIITDREELRSFLEPNSSSVDDRLDALERFSEAGISTYAFIGPVIPGLTDGEKDLKRLMGKLVERGVRRVLIDRLNLRYGVLQNLTRHIELKFPNLIDKFQSRVKAYNEYCREMKKLLSRIAKDSGLDYEFCF